MRQIDSLRCVLGCALVLAAGCAKKDATCESAVGNLMRIEYYGAGRNPSLDERKMLDEMLPGARAKLVDWCYRRELSAEDLSCVAAARARADWKECGAFNEGYGPPLPDPPAENGR